MATGMEATASSVYNSNTLASKSVDGNIDTIHHSKCNENPWWRVDLGVMSFVQDVKITNRRNCCGGRLRQATVKLLDEDLNLVDSRYIEGGVGNGAIVQKVFNEADSEARYVEVSFNRNDCLHMAEVQVYGYHLMAKPTSSPTPETSNLALGKPATQSSTYNNNPYDAASMAVDGNYNSFTHTHCWQGINQWWRVDLEDVYTIATITVGNRLDCCGGRFHDATFYFYDENEVEVYVMPTSGYIGSKKSFSVGKCLHFHVRKPHSQSNEFTLTVKFVLLLAAQTLSVRNILRLSLETKIVCRLASLKLGAGRNNVFRLKATSLETMTFVKGTYFAPRYRTG